MSAWSVPDRGLWMLILFRCPAGWTLLDSWLYSSDYLMNRVCKLCALLVMKLQFGLLQSHKCGTCHQQLITGTLLCDISSTSFRLRRSIATCGMWHVKKYFTEDSLLSWALTDSLLLVTITKWSWLNIPTVISEEECQGGVRFSKFSFMPWCIYQLVSL